MTFAELRTLTITWLDDLNYGYYTAAQINTWLNNAQRECQKLLLLAGQNYYVKPVQTTLVVDQNEYVLPDDFLVLNRLAVVISGTAPNQSIVPLGAITLNQQDLVGTSGNGTPGVYYIKRNRLVLLPYPDTALPLQLYYSPTVTDMTLDTDIPNIPVQYQEYLAVLATLDGLLRDNRSDAEMMRKKEMIEKPLKEMAEMRRVDSPRVIINTGLYENVDFWEY